MAIIDLGTGAIVSNGDSLQGQSLQDSSPDIGVSTIIDLDTGQRVPIAPQADKSPQTTQPPKTGVADIFTGSERISATPELGELPEFGTTQEGDTFKMALGLLSTFDPQAQKDIIQEQIPGVVFETTPDGSTIIEVPTEAGGTRRSVLNRPGFSPQDLTTATAQVLSFVPAGRIASLGKTLAQKVGIGAAAAGATEQALQEGGIALGREERDPVSTAIAAGTGGLAEAVVPAIQGLRSGSRASRIGAEKTEVAKAVESIRPVTEAVEGLEKATGQRVGLFRAQQTQIPSELTKQRILPQLDAGSRVAADALESQNKEVFDATTKLIETIAPEGSIVSASSNFRNASQKALSAASKERSAAVKPLYDAAFSAAEGASVDLKPVIQFVNRELSGLVSDDPAAIALNSFMNRLKGTKEADKAAGLIVDRSGSPIIRAQKGATVPLSLQQLQSAKFTTDAAIDKSGGVVLNSAQKNAKRLLSEAESIYVDQIGKISPEFAAANKEFARLSGPIKELEDSLIGQVAKISDTQIKNIAQTIFDPKSGLTDPSAIIKAKKVINAVDPQAWDDLLRVEMNRRIGGLEQLIEEVPGDFVGNIPGQLRRTLFGNPSQRKALLSGMNEGQKQNFKYLETVLKRASSGRSPGSPTAAFGQAIDKLKGVSAVVRDIIFRPLSTLQQTGERGIFDRNVAALSRAMFDPKFKPRMDKLKALDPNSPAAGRALTQLIDDIQAAEPAQEEQ
jgi:hypothetical protein